MRDAEAPANMRLDAAKWAAPFCHPRLSAVEVSGKNGGPVETQATVVTLDMARRVAFLLEKGRRALEGNRNEGAENRDGGSEQLDAIKVLTRG